MTWESEEEQAKPRRDWARLMWYGVGALMVAGIAAMFLPRQEDVESTRVRVSHILVKLDAQNEAGVQAALDEITAMRQQILAGASFSTLAAKHSDDPLSAAKGGDLGWVHKGELAEAIDEYMWKAPLNEVSQVIPTSYGLHLVVVRDRQVSKAELYELELKDRVLKGQGAAETPEP